jgi:heme-degrading monooxygenase HmoA
VKTSASPQDQHLFRIDKFKVPAAARNEFLDRVRSTHQLLRTQPGFVRDGVYEQTEGPGSFNFVTLVEWENSETLEVAKKTVAAKHLSRGLHNRCRY